MYGIVVNDDDDDDDREIPLSHYPPPLPTQP